MGAGERFGEVRQVVHTGRDAIALWDALEAIEDADERAEATRYALEVWGVDDADVWTLARRAAWEIGLGRSFASFPAGEYELWYYDPDGGHFDESANDLTLDELASDDEDTFEGVDSYQRVAQAGSLPTLLEAMFEDFAADAWEIAGDSAGQPWSHLKDARLRMEAELVQGESSMMELVWEADKLVYGAAFVEAAARSRTFVVGWEAIPHLQDVATCILRVRR